MTREQNRISFGALMATVLLLVSSSLLFFYHLGKTEFSREQPARIAVYARQLAQNGLWLAPIVRGEPRIDVPPMYLWSVRLVAFFSSNLKAFESRLPGAISALLLVLLAAWWLYRHVTRYSREDLMEGSPEAIALLAGLMLATNPITFVFGRQGTLSAMFTLVYLGAAYCWGESLEARRSFYAGRSWRTWCFWGYLLAGVAMLVNGPLVLPLLWVPYLLAARAYHLRKPDLIHLWGALLALLIGLSWPTLIQIHYPAVAPELWREWLSLRVGSDYHRHVEPYRFLLHVISCGFPWIILAGVMAVRVWMRKDRSPTLVFWMSSLLGNIIVLTTLSNHIGQHLLPVMVFVTLLATDGIYRWNFETPWATVWRTLLRVSLVLAIVGGIFITVLLNSALGLALFIALPVGWLVWVIYSRMQGWQFTPWETSTRLSALIVFVFFVIEAILLSYGEPRREFHDDRLSYFQRVKRHMPDDRQVYLASTGMSILYDYYLDPEGILGRNLQLKDIHPTPDDPAYLFAEKDGPHDLEQWQQDPRLRPETFYYGNRMSAPVEGMFKVSPDANATPTSATLGTTSTLAVAAAPVSATMSTTATTPTLLRVIALGNAGTRAKAQRAVAKQAYRYVRRAPVDDALLLGNNLYGPSVFDHLAFVKAFEQPYQSLLKRGIAFHAVLGHEDQSYGWVETRYTPFNMQDDRYYVQSMGGGLVDFFALDAERLVQGKTVDPQQLKWLESALAASRAPWKIVGLSQPLLSSTAKGEANAPLAAALLPLFDRYKVNIVAWNGGQWYAHLTTPDHAPVFFNAGWSGGKDKVEFSHEPQIKAAFAKQAGFVAFEFGRDSATFRAINERGETVDEGQIPGGGGAKGSSANGPVTGKP